MDGKCTVTCDCGKQYHGYGMFEVDACTRANHKREMCRAKDPDGHRAMREMRPIADNINRSLANYETR